MAVTLSDISKLLQDKNEKQTIALQNIDKSTSLTAKNIGMLKGLFEKDKFKELEEDLESKATSRRVEVQTSKGKSSSGKGGGLFSGFADMFPQGGLFGLGAALASQLPKFLLGRALPALLAKAFADEIADYIESETGSKDFADAIYRGLNLGALGLLFGKKFAALGFVTGMVMSPANRQKMEIEFENLEVNIAHFTGKVEDFFNMELPDLSETFSYLAGAPAKALEGINAALTGDGEGFVDNLDEMGVTLLSLAAIIRPGGTLRLIAKTVAGLGLAISKLNSSMMGLTPPGGGAGVAGGAPKMTEKSRFQMNTDLEKMTDKKLNKLGLERKGGALYDKATGNVASNAKMQEALISSGKHGRLAKFLRAPGIGWLMGAYDIYSILGQEGSFESKVPALGGTFASILGSGGGAMLGAALGGMLTGPLAPAGALIGSLMGGIAGYTMSGPLGMGLAQYLMGEKVNAFPDWTGLNSMLNSPGSTSPQVNIPESVDEFSDMGSDGANLSAANKMFIPKPPKISSDDFRFFQGFGENSGQAIVYAPVATDARQFNSSGVAVSAPLGVAQIDGKSLLS